MILEVWAKHWRIPLEALEELKTLLSPEQTKIKRNKLITNENDIKALVQIEAQAKGHVLWRNNVGCLKNSRGQIVRYGLANQSKSFNEEIKSSDLVGVRKVKIDESMIGDIIGQFLCREVKKDGWKYKGTDREMAQKRWIDWIISLGGDAAFASGEGSI